jgi:anaerobic selenocysteine-containing dehydrogenase
MRGADTAVKVVNSVCPHDCPSACALDVDLLADGRIGRVRGAAQPYTDGIVCAKVARYAERVHHPDRLMTPLKRSGPKGSGAFTPISWDQALDEVAAAFRAATQQHGAEAVWPYFYAGTMGQVHRDGIQRLRHVMGYSGQHKTFCTMLASTGWEAATGSKIGTQPEEMADAELIVIWGGNPVNTQVHVMNWVAKARKDHGAKVVVIDPYRTETAKKADLHLALRPGTDGALACAVMHVLFAEGMVDWAWMERHTDDPHGLQASLQEKTPQWAAGITGLSVDEITTFARMYGQTLRSFIRVGYGFTRSRNGAVNMHAVACLPSVRGAWAHQGGGALWATSGVYGLDKSLIEATECHDPGVRVLDMSRIGPVLCGDVQDLGDGPPVTAMLIQNTNPAVTAPRSALVRQGLAREDLFLCVHEQFMTETARYADIVLPATMFLEHEDFYAAGAHTYMQGHKAVLPAPGECRSNHDVICALAKRLGAKHPGFELSAWDLMDQSLKASGYDGAEALISRRWENKGLSGDAARFADGFGHADKKFHFRPNWAKYGPTHQGMPEFPDHHAVIDEATAERPFRLVAAPARQFLNSSFSETPTSRRLEKTPTAQIHPQDAQALGLQPDAMVVLGNAYGDVTLAWKSADGIARGVIVVESLWPNADFPGGLGINTLISAEAGYPNGGGVFHDTSVWVKSIVGDEEGS